MNYCKLLIVFKSKTRLGSNILFKDRIPKDLTSGVIYKIQCGLSNASYYVEYVINHLNVRISEHIGISPLSKKQIEPMNSSVTNHLLFCNHSASYNNFSILPPENKNILTKIEIEPVNDER